MRRELAAVHDRAEVDRGVERVADAEPPARVDDALHDHVPDGTIDEHARAGEQVCPWL